MSELRRHSHSVSSDLPVNNTCHGCIANARELVEARRKIDDLTRAAERNAGLAEVETTRFANERLSIELDEMKQIAEQLAWLMQDVLSVLADNFRQKADTETLGSALLTCLAPAKGFGTSLKNHYEQFEDAVGGNIDFETSPPTVHESRPSVQHASCFGDPESSTSPSGATRRYPEFSSLLGYALGGTRHQPPGSDHSSTSLSTEDHHLTVDPKPSAIPSPTHIRAEIGVPTDEEVPAIRPVGADSEKLDAFLDNLRRESFRGSSRPSVLSDEEDERDHEVGLFLDSVITRPTSGRASVPGIVPPAFLSEPTGPRMAHRKTMA